MAFTRETYFGPAFGPSPAYIANTRTGDPRPSRFSQDLSGRTGYVPQPETPLLTNEEWCRTPVHRSTRSPPPSRLAPPQNRNWPPGANLRNKPQHGATLAVKFLNHFKRRFGICSAHGWNRTWWFADVPRGPAAATWPSWRCPRLGAPGKGDRPPGPILRATASRAKRKLLSILLKRRSFALGRYRTKGFDSPRLHSSFP